MATRTTEERVRAICMALPGVTEKLSHSAPAFFVKKQFLHLWASGHHENHFPHLWCAAPAGAQEELVETEPKRFFRPPYVGSRGWIGVRLDGKVDWGEIAEICKDAYRVVAPPKLAAAVPADPVIYFQGRFAGRGPSTEEMRATETADEINAEEAKARRVSQ